MRLYNGRFLRNKTQKLVDQKVETRSAILVDILPMESKARVKIQGTSTLIVANYPRNFDSNPPWLKPGNCVTIRHTGGNRGRIELVGDGYLIPTPVKGDTTVITVTNPNVVLSGLTLTPDGGMTISITAGTVRFSGSESSVPATTKTVNAAPSSGNFRYDLIVIGPDLVIDYIAGTAASTPAMPAIPPDHLSLGWVLVPSGKTEILASDINAGFIEPRPTVLNMTITDTDMSWTDTSTDVTIDIKDQYGNAYSASGTMTLSFATGNGTISDGGSKSFSGSSVSFTYTRDGNDPGDASPMLRATFGMVSAYDTIILRDVNGYPM